jgi:ABC-type transport system involved in cytochrome c biogenesis permease subunit
VSEVLEALAQLSVLAIGLFIRARYEEAAANLQPTFGMASNIALLALTVLGLVLNFNTEEPMQALNCSARTCICVSSILVSLAPVIES